MELPSSVASCDLKNQCRKGTEAGNVDIYIVHNAHCFREMSSGF